MDEILRNLLPGTRVLDLGSLTGSFSSSACPASFVARVDLEVPRTPCEGFVQADAACLPFPNHCFDAVIASHSLEHFKRLDEALKEIARVVRPNGSLYVAVPDASTLSDRLYRRMLRGGGHVNPFRSAEVLGSTIAHVTGLRLAGVRDLYSSFEYLNRSHWGPRTPWSLRLVGNGNRQVIVWLSYLTRVFDHFLGTRLSAYGWAFYFGSVPEEISGASWSNVCVECGRGFPAAWLLACNLVVRRKLFLRSYQCPYCSACNLFTSDS